MTLTLMICPDCDDVQHGEHTMCNCGNLNLEHYEIEVAE